MDVVYQANSIIDAYLVKHVLEEADIPVYVFGENLMGGAGELPIFGVIRVCVPPSFILLAQEVIKPIIKQLNTPFDDSSKLNDYLEDDNSNIISY